MARRIVIWAFGPAAAAGAGVCAAGGERAAEVSGDRVRLHRAWRAMPRPPVTPYTGPFGGEARALGPVKAAQAKLSAMDLSAPKYFLDRPELNAPEYNTPIPPVGR